MSEAGVGVGNEVVQSDAPARPEIPGVRTGVDGADGDRETDAIGGCHLAAAPDPGDAELGLEVDEAGVGRHDRLGADVVGGHPGQTGLREGRDIGTGDRPVADVAGLGQQHGAGGEVEIGDAAATATGVGEGVGETTPTVDLEQDLGQVDRV